MAHSSNPSLVAFFLLFMFQMATPVHLKGMELVEVMKMEGGGETSLLLPAVIQVMQGISDQMEEEKPAKGSTHAPPSGHRMPPGLLRLVALRNGLVSAARHRKLGKHNGFSDETYALLKESSRGTAVEQLKTLLVAMLKKKELMEEGDEASISELASDVVKDLEDEKSNLSTILGKLKPIQYTR